jgi:hypothetical protein
MCVCRAVQWEEKTGRVYRDLPYEEREKANAEIRVMQAEAAAQPATTTAAPRARPQGVLKQRR